MQLGSIGLGLKHVKQLSTPCPKQLIAANYVQAARQKGITTFYPILGAMFEVT